MEYGRKRTLIRKPKLTRIETLTKGLQEDPAVILARFTTQESDKGRGVYCKVPCIKKDSFVIEYEGEVISRERARKRERIYHMNGEGCYLMDFVFQGKRFTMDATRMYNSVARLVNHSRSPNIQWSPPIVVDLDGDSPPRIAAYALRDIMRGEEILFDYNVTDSKLTWLRSKDNGTTVNLDAFESEEEEEDITPTNCSSLFNSPRVRQANQRPFPTQIDGSSQLSQELTSNILSQQSLTSQKRTKKGECKIKFISETFGDQKHFYSYNLDIGQPATILRFKDDNSRTKLKPDVISLSSEEGPPVKCKKSKPSVPETISESVQEVQQRLSVIMDMNLINVPVLSSAKKVEQWQAQTQNIQKNIETSSASEIMISGVMSLRDPDRVTPSTSSAQLPNLDDDQIFDLPDIRELTHRQIVSDSSSDCEILDEEPPKWVPLRCGEKPYAVIKPFSSPSSRVKLDLKPTSSVLPSSSKVSLGNAENDVKPPVFSPEEEEGLMSFSKNFTTNLGMSKDQIENTIASNWEFFSRLIQRGISINQIRSFVNSVTGSKGNTL